jgi:hypothetical protein
MEGSGSVPLTSTDNSADATARVSYLTLQLSCFKEVLIFLKNLPGRSSTDHLKATWKTFDIVPAYDCSILLGTNKYHISVKL